MIRAFANGYFAALVGGTVVILALGEIRRVLLAI